MFKPHPPVPPPAPPCGFLIPKIIGCGREWIRCRAFSLCACGMPEGACPPFTLCAVSHSAQPPWWEELACHERGAKLLLIGIPLSLSVRDARGCLLCCAASVEIQLRLRLSCPAAECWRHALTILPCVRLACGPTPFEGACVDAPLEIVCEAYLLRHEAVRPGPCPPACPPPKPLYPPPCHPEPPPCPCRG